MAAIPWSFQHSSSPVTATSSPNPYERHPDPQVAAIRTAALNKVAYRPEGIGDVRRIFSGEILFAEELLSFEV